MHINEIFTSLSGEADGFGLQGGLATFVRLQGCNLKCRWCDTQYAHDFADGKDQHVKEVAEQCIMQHIIITGGEPLLQAEEVVQLVDLLLSSTTHKITIETNGSILSNIDPKHVRYASLRWVVDYKLDSSGECEAMVPEVFRRLYPLDVIKFVIADLQDYRQALDIMLDNQHWLAKKVFSPVPKKNWPVQLAQKMVEDKLEDVTLSLQWHKILKIK